ncbi:hypothetical protein Tco_0933642, partial [Tanacetum coccineum]
MPTDPQYTPTIIQPSTSQPQLKQRSRRLKRKDTEVPQPNGHTYNVADDAINEVMDDSLVRAATTASSLEAEKDIGNIDNTRSKATLNEPNPQGTGSGSCPKRQDTMGDIIARTRSARVISSDEASLGDQEDASKQERKIDDINKDVEITLVHETQGSVDEVTLAQALASLKIAKPKADKVMLQELEQGTITTNAATTVTAASTRP